MADSQDKSNQSDQQKLAELEKQLSKDSTESKPAAKVAEKPVAAKIPEAKPASSKPASGSRTTSASKASSSSRPASPVKNQTNSKTKALWFFTILNLLLLLTLIAAGYWGWLQWQKQNQSQADALVAQQDSVSQQQSEIAQSISANQLAKSELEQQNQALQSSIQSLVEELQETSAQVRANQQNLADVSGRRPADWLLAEADYLVRMAGRKLWLEHDVKTATMMLQSADSRLQDLDDPSLLPVRERLATDIQNLQQVNQVSISSIALALGALAQQADSLPLAFFKKPEAEQAEEPVSGSVNDWRSNLARNWSEVTKDFFSVKRKTAEIKPFMSNQEQWLAREQLRFSLLQAQVAVLKENKTLYQQSLNTSVGLLVEYFDTEQVAVVQFSESLSELQKTDIERVYPEQFTAAPMLQDVINRRLESRFVNGDA